MSRRLLLPGLRPANDATGAGGELLFWLTGMLFAAALVFGGASRENLLPVLGLELVAIPVMALAIWRLSLLGAWRGLAVPAAILLAAAAIPLLQLMPLPFEVWAKLPGHATAATALRLAGLDHGWRPLSLAPIETSRNLLALIPPAAVFLATAALSTEERRRLAGLIPVAAAVSLLIGLIQVAGGPDSRAYFYAITNDDSAVGLFANRNHQAALLVVALPFAALWIDLSGRRRRGMLLSLALGFSIFLVEIVGLIEVRSRAGVLLMAPALIAGLLLIRRGGLNPKLERRALVGFGVLIVAALAVGLAFGSGGIRERFAQLDEGRLHIAPLVVRAGADTFPFGAGVGSFPQVFMAYEPINGMTQTFWNHAHDDYLEIWLEAGLTGIAVVLGFVVWWGSRLRAAWQTRSGRQDRLARAAGVATALLLVHSVVDYPLRTLAIACVFAFACAVLARAPAIPEVSSGRRTSRPEPERPSSSAGSSRALPEGGRRRVRSR